MYVMLTCSNVNMSSATNMCLTLPQHPRLQGFCKLLLVRWSFLPIAFSFRPRNTASEYFCAFKLVFLVSQLSKLNFQQYYIIIWHGVQVYPCMSYSTGAVVVMIVWQQDLEHICNQCLSQAITTSVVSLNHRQGEEYSIISSNLSVTCDRSVVVYVFSGFLH